LFHKNFGGLINLKILFVVINLYFSKNFGYSRKLNLKGAGLNNFLVALIKLDLFLYLIK